MASYNSSFNHLVTYLYRDKIQPRPHRYRQLYLSDMLNSSNFMYTQDIRGHYSCVNALAFSHFDQQYLASGGDGCRILIWKIESLLDCDNQYNFMMRKVHNSNIFSIGFSCDDSFIFSAGQ
jgi:WD repeat-containing protein 22